MDCCAILVKRRKRRSGEACRTFTSRRRRGIIESAEIASEKCLFGSRLVVALLNDAHDHAIRLLPGIQSRFVHVGRAQLLGEVAQDGLAEVLVHLDGDAAAVVARRVLGEHLDEHFGVVEVVYEGRERVEHSVTMGGSLLVGAELGDRHGGESREKFVVVWIFPDEPDKVNSVDL